MESVERDVYGVEAEEGDPRSGEDCTEKLRLLCRGDDIGLVSGGLHGVKDIYDVESSASCADRLHFLFEGDEVRDAKLWHGV